MTILTTTGVLQAATVIAKTTETLISEEIRCGSYDFITLFGTYTKGDETGLNIVPYFMQEYEGTARKLVLWSEAGGVYTAEQTIFQLTATIEFSIKVDIRGIEFIKFMQGGSNNDGTPTGTLAASYAMTK